MAVPNKRGPYLVAALALAFLALAISVRADEIRLKGGKKLYGVIVAYEDNMFKVKTDFGYVLVEKDKIESIIPSTPAGKPESESTPKKDAAKNPAKPDGDSQPQAEPAVATSSDVSTTPANASAKTTNASGGGKSDKAPAKITNATAKPEVPASAAASNAAAPAIKGSPAASENGPSASAATPAPPKEPELPANREEIQGNLYTNYTHGFKMYKAPSWNLIEEARRALPNAIVAMGTANESTLMVVGEEKTKDSLEPAAAAVEKRLHEVYSKYQQTAQRKTVVGGLPAMEYQYRGTADEHDWSGKLVVVARGKDIFTVLAMTYADSDLIQIQENVIARSIASLDFSVH
jgi:small nuclear ribonucleoprotein (snRNP)-like protein